MEDQLIEWGKRNCITIYFFAIVIFFAMAGGWEPSEKGRTMMRVASWTLIAWFVIWILSFPFPGILDYIGEILSESPEGIWR